MNTLEIPLPFIMSDWTPEVRELLRLVVVAHQQSAVANQNVSSFAAVNGMAGSGDFSKACAGALLSIGGRHAPISEARALFEIATDPREHVYRPDMIWAGYGNSFFKEGDPAWGEVEDWLQRKFSESWDILTELTFEVHRTRPHLLPNAAMWTAIACIEAGIPEGYESLIFLLARAPAWATLCMKPEEVEA